MIGEILSGRQRARGNAGLVCDREVRDAGALGARDDFPVIARWTTQRGPTGADPGAVNLPVMVGRCAVAPGDLSTADVDRLVSLPPAVMRDHIADAETRSAREAR